jgi:hypothetical protein
MENINIYDYLNEARRKARKYGYNGHLQLSGRPDKKLKYIDDKTGKVINFGSKTNNDKIIYKMLFNSNVAKEKARLYRARAWKVFNEAPKLSPSHLSWYILW